MNPSKEQLMTAKKTKVIVLEPMQHDGEDVAPGAKVEMTEKQANAAIDAHVACPDTPEGRAFAKERLADSSQDDDVDAEEAGSAPAAKKTKT